MIDLLKIKKIHFIGIGGIGISAIARMFSLEGKIVSGSDQSVGLVTEELTKLGIEVFIGHCASQIPLDVDLVVYTIAIPVSNPELAKAKELNIPVLSYPEILGLVSKEKFTIAVAGTHGKTTTTAMLAKIFIDAKFDPTVIVGSFLKDSPKSPAGDRSSNFVAGLSQYLIVEACEYRRSFLNLNPNILVITNLEADHLDYYHDLKDIQLAFTDLVNKVPATGFIICDLNDKNIKPVIKSAKAKIIDYQTISIDNLKLQFPGEHFRLDAKASLAVAEAVEINLESSLRSLAEFSGTWRRFEFKGQTKNGALVYDDYAHHPDEIKATLQGVKEKYPTQKIIAVFQPHLYSRTKQFLTDFVSSLTLADEVLILPIYAAREEDDGLASDLNLVAQLSLTTTTRYAKSFKEAQIDLNNNVSKDSVIIVMGAGNVSDLANDLII